MSDHPWLYLAPAVVLAIVCMIVIVISRCA